MEMSTDPDQLVADGGFHSSRGSHGHEPTHPAGFGLTAACVLIALLAWIAGTVLHARVLFSDSAMFEYAGRAMLRGALLYRDVWDNKPPGIYLVNALWQQLFGPAYVLHALAENTVGLGSSFLAGAVARAFGVRRWPIVVAASAIVLGDFTLTQNAVEYDALPFLLASVLLARNGRAAAAGIAVAVATIFWVPGIIMVLPLAMLLSGGGRVRLTLAAGLSLATMIGVLAAVIGTEALRLLVTSWIAYVPSAVAPSHRRFALLGPLIDFVQGVQGAGIGMLAILLIGNLRRSRTQAERFVLAWVAVMFVATFVGFRFYSHYYIPAVAATIVALGVFGISVRGARAAAVILAAVAALASARGIPSYFAFASDRTARAERTGHAIVEALTPGATIDVPDDYAPELYLYADASLRDPYEIVAGPNAAFLSRLHLRVAPAAITVLVLPSSRAPSGEVPVCRATSAPWRVFSARVPAGRFGTCP